METIYDSAMWVNTLVEQIVGSGLVGLKIKQSQ